MFLMSSLPHAPITVFVTSLPAPSLLFSERGYQEDRTSRTSRSRLTDHMSIPSKVPFSRPAMLFISG